VHVFSTAWILCAGRGGLLINFVGYGRGTRLEFDMARRHASSMCAPAPPLPGGRLTELLAWFLICLCKLCYSQKCVAGGICRLSVVDVMSGYWLLWRTRSMLVTNSMV
jgi:hypothetical protein